MKNKHYRPIRKKLTESEAVELMGKAMAQRMNCVEQLLSIKIGLVTPLIQVVCHQSLDDMIEQNIAQIEWLDRRIEDLQRFINKKVTITDFLG